jgi:pimeloyl-ACP methyl ester carboxylesterase
MSTPDARGYRVPWLPPGHTLVLPGRGEVFYRHHVHPDPTRPVLLLLHGWTASADLQFFTAYELLAEHYSFVAIDHRGHGRGMRPDVRFELEDAADDAAALVDALGVGPVVTVGYSMGGPISLLLARRHPHVVTAMVVEATALDWRSTRWERWRWKAVRLMGPILRSWAYPRSLRYGLKRLMGPGHALEAYTPWLVGELRRSDTFAVVEAGEALSRYDARPWAGSLGLPARALITTRDRLVRPPKQRALALALGAATVEVEADHLCPLVLPHEWSAATLELVRDLVG